MADEVAQRQNRQRPGRSQRFGGDVGDEGAGLLLEPEWGRKSIVEQADDPRRPGGGDRSE